MADETRTRYADVSGTSDRMPDELSSEIEKERQSSARLRDNLADTIKHSLPSKQEARDMLRSAGEKVQDTAQYVQDRYLRDMGSKAAAYARRQPLAAIGIAMACGFLIGRAIRR